MSVFGKSRLELSGLLGNFAGLSQSRLSYHHRNHCQKDPHLPQLHPLRSVMGKVGGHNAVPEIPQKESPPSQLGQVRERQRLACATRPHSSLPENWPATWEYRHDLKSPFPLSSLCIPGPGLHRRHALHSEPAMWAPVNFISDWLTRRRGLSASHQSKKLQSWGAHRFRCQKLEEANVRRHSYWTN